MSTQSLNVKNIGPIAFIATGFAILGITFAGLIAPAISSAFTLQVTMVSFMASIVFVLVFKNESIKWLVSAFVLSVMVAYLPVNTPEYYASFAGQLLPNEVLALLPIGLAFFVYRFPPTTK